MKTVAVIDYGMGNLHSVAKALEHVAPDQRILVTADHSRILEADRVVLPGVGAMRDCMGEIRRLGLDDVVHHVAGSRPLLGVCVGMQAMMDFSAENNGVPCLGLFKGSVEPFDMAMRDPLNQERLKVPHMGWNQVRQVIDHPLWHGIPPDSRFYFVHSYYVRPAQASVVVGTTEYGLTFASAIASDKVFAVQFHPEKSQHAGLQLYENFVGWQGES